MSLWEIRRDGFDVPVEFAELQQVEAENSYLALTEYRSQLKDMIQNAHDDIELDQLADLQSAKVVAVPIQQDSPPAEPAPRILTGSSAAIAPTAGNGYDFMNANAALGWKSLPAWGKDGWDMGRWPLVCVMTNDDFQHPRTLVYIEGDVEVWEFENIDDRVQYLDKVAEQFWRSGDADGPKDLAAFETGALPERYRGDPQIFGPPVPAATHVGTQPVTAPPIEVRLGSN